MDAVNTAVKQTTHREATSLLVSTSRQSFVPVNENDPVFFTGRNAAGARFCYTRGVTLSTSSLKNISSILPLREEQTMRGPCHGNPEEVVKIPKISHSKLTV